MLENFGLPPSLTASPNSGLTDLQSVQVSGSNLQPNTTYQLEECAQQGCDATTAVAATTDSSGSLGHPYTVHQHLTINAQPFNCDGSGCAIAIAFPGPPFAPISFAGPPSPSLTASSNSGLTDLQSVQVSGSNLQPNTPYQLEECTLQGCDATTTVVASSNGSGMLGPTPYTVHQHITVNAQPVDCAVTGCAIAALGGPGSPPFATISFAPAPASLTVSPNSGLTDGQSVAVSGSNLQPTTPYQLEECTTAGCDATTVVVATSDGSGNLASTSYTVHQHLTINAQPFNCDGSGCAIAALGGPGSPPFATISFQPLPTIASFSPSSGPVGTSVTITGTNFNGATSVTFNGTTAIFTVNSDTQITVTVPAGATTGPIAVTTPEGTATGSTHFIVFAYSTGGSFVIGDQNASVGASVTFWGAQWAKDNGLSAGSAPNSFKGFAHTPTTAPACATRWSTGPGNSSGPPDTVPSYMAVIVTSSATKSGSTISGNTTKLVIVKTDPGYASNPGHAGTGTVVAVLPCS